MATHLEITVWDLREGDVLRVLYDASWDDYDDLKEQYDEPWHDIVIDREWDEGDED